MSRLLAWCRHLLVVCGGTTTDVESVALARLQASVLALCQHVCPIRDADTDGGCVPDLAVELVLARSGAVDVMITACSDALRVLRCSRPAATSHLDRLDEAVRLAVVALVGPAFIACGDGLQQAVRALPRRDVVARAALLSAEGTLEFDRLPLHEMMDLRDFMAVLEGAVCLRLPLVDAYAKRACDSLIVFSTAPPFFGVFCSLVLLQQALSQSRSTSAGLQHELVGPALLTTHVVNDVNGLAHEFGLLLGAIASATAFALPLAPVRQWFMCLDSYTRTVAGAVAGDTVATLGFQPTLALADLGGSGSGGRGSGRMALDTGFVDHWWSMLCREAVEALSVHRAQALARLKTVCMLLASAMGDVEVDCRMWQDSMEVLLAFREDGHRRKQESFLTNLTAMFWSWVQKVCRDRSCCMSTVLFGYCDVGVFGKFGSAYAMHLPSRICSLRMICACRRTTWRESALPSVSG